MVRRAVKLGQVHVQGMTALGPKVQDEWVPGALGDVTPEPPEGLGQTRGLLSVGLCWQRLS